MDTTLEQQLNQTGRARVIAVLEETPTLATSEAPRLTSRELPALAAFAAPAKPGGTRLFRAAAPPGGGPIHFPRLGIILGSVSSAGASALMADPGVKDVLSPSELELVAPATAAPSASPTGISWGITAIGVPELWERGLTGKGVGIAHLDTGVDATHPALTGRVVSFAEFDAQAQELPGVTAYDSATHGTHTAGTLAGGEFNSLKIGVAPGAELHSCRVIDYPDSLVRILAGMDWALGQPVRVLNMSVGVKGYDPFLLTVMERIRAAGVLPVIAVGNEGMKPGHSTRSPANYPDTVAVGAVDNSGGVAFFSSYGIVPDQPGLDKPDLVAPGTNIWSSVPGPQLESLMGSSMAAPHVAGLATLLFESKPDATVDEVQDAILSTCTPIDGAAADKFGRGVVHGPAAADRLAAGP